MNLLSLKLCKVMGVPVVIHWSTLLFLLVAILLNPTFGLVFSFAYLIVILHELGHSTAAKYYKAYVQDIVIYPFGGMASIDWNAILIPKQEFFITIAGPMVNAILCVPLSLCFCFESPLFDYVFNANIVMLAFNMLPIFPLDGGRLVRSILAMFFTSYLKATIIAARLGQACAVVLFLAAVYYTYVFVAIISIYAMFAAQSEIKAVRERHSEDFMQQMARRMARLSKVKPDTLRL